MVYDSSLGSCLNILHSSCSDAIVEITAAGLINVFPQSMQRTKSQELKVSFPTCSYIGKLFILVRHLFCLSVFLTDMQSKLLGEVTKTVY
jgi:hypothetical protein